MSKLGRQQISQKLLADIVEIVRTTSFVTISEEEPQHTANGSFWLQTGLDTGVYPSNPNEGGNIDPSAPPQGQLIVANAIIEDDEPTQFDPATNIWFDLEP